MTLRDKKLLERLQLDNILGDGGDTEPSSEGATILPAPSITIGGNVKGTWSDAVGGTEDRNHNFIIWLLCGLAEVEVAGMLLADDEGFVTIITDTIEANLLIVNERRGVLVITLKSKRNAVLDREDDFPGDGGQSSPLGVGEVALGGEVMSVAH
jgi:hypothetical protein